jgi:hypothetical protein
VRFLVLIGALALSACGASVATTTLHEVAAPLPAAPSGWVELTPRPTQLDGRLFTPTCSHAPGADPAYRFWVKRGSADGLVVFFDGGGACWDDVTCAGPRLARDSDDDEGFYKAELIPTDNPNTMQGIFDLSDPRNPVRDWSFVFVPYCTADVHSGSNTAHYTNPDTNETFTIEHRGADNFRVVLEWMRANFRAPGEILVTGSSAGAYGAATHFARIREAFPAGRAVMLGDAGQGVTTPEFLTTRNRNWNYQLPASVFGSNATLTVHDDLVARVAQHFPADRFAQYTTAHDITQSGFYALMGAENACRAWTQKMAGDLRRRQTANNFRSYLAAGQSHTILRTPRFYTETSGGAPFLAWFAELIGENAPDNAACENCLTQQVRCRF